MKQNNTSCYRYSEEVYNMYKVSWTVKLSHETSLRQISENTSQMGFMKMGITS